MATAPITMKQKNLNIQLEDYATSAGISFVSNEVILDETTGDFKEWMMNGIHYTPLGTSQIAKQLKRSLYAKEPLQTAPQQRRHPQALLRPAYLTHHNKQLAGQNRQYQSSSNANPHNTQGLVNALSSLLQKWQNPPGSLQ